MVYRYNVEWSIPNAGPSISVFHFGHVGQQSPKVAVDALREAIFAVRSYIPDEVTATFPPGYSELNNQTGQIVDFGSITPPATVTGGYTGTWAGGSGIRLVWDTNVVARGRRVRGTTFLVPMGQNAFTNSGVVAPAAITAFNTAFGTYLTTAGASVTRPMIYSRPLPGEPGSGNASHIVAVNTSVRAATLRKRKY